MHTQIYKKVNLLLLCYDVGESPKNDKFKKYRHERPYSIGFHLHKMSIERQSHKQKD